MRRVLASLELRRAKELGGRYFVTEATLTRRVFQSHASRAPETLEPKLGAAKS